MIESLRSPTIYILHRNKLLDGVLAIFPLFEGKTSASDKGRTHTHELRHHAVGCRKVKLTVRIAVEWTINYMTKLF